MYQKSSEKCISTVSLPVTIEDRKKVQRRGRRSIIAFDGIKRKNPTYHYIFLLACSFFKIFKKCQMFLVLSILSGSYCLLTVMDLAGLGETPLSSNSNSKDLAVSKECNQRKHCAILFFGLTKEFTNLVYPSIQRNILEVNGGSDCDIYVHTYNITNVPYNPRSLEVNGSEVHIDEVFTMTENVSLTSMEEFWQVRGDFVERTKQYYHKKWGQCCISHTNMIKQWHSIHKVWELMREGERKIMNSADGVYYDQIGMFRLDTYFPTPISIFEHDAGVADFKHSNGLNDRLFYGKRENVEAWADRFGFQEEFESKYMDDKWRYHSETYVGELMKSRNVDVTKNSNLCTWRVRSGMKVMLNECYVSEFKWIFDIARETYLPNGYHYHVNKEEKNKIWEISRDEDYRDITWPNVPKIDKRRSYLQNLYTEKVCLR